MSDGATSMRSALSPAPQSLALPLGCSVGFHVGGLIAAGVARLFFGGVAAVFAMLFPWCRAEPAAPLADIEVTVVSQVPKSETSMPTRPARVERQQGKPTPKPQPPKPAPVRESDLVVRTPEAPKPKPGNTEEDLALQRQTEELRQQALDELLGAPEGPVDRDLASPDGEGEVAVAALAAGAQGDPAFVRWYAQVDQMVKDRFKPVGRTDGLFAKGHVVVDPQTGQVTSYSLDIKSDVLSYDSAAERALAATQRLPLPPEKYVPLLRRPVFFEFGEK